MKSDIMINIKASIDWQKVCCDIVRINNLNEEDVVKYITENIQNCINIIIE